MTVSEAVDGWLATVELDELGDTRASIARALAQKLDEAGHQDSGSIAMAMSGIAKELRATIDAIRDDSGGVDLFLADLFGQVGDS